MAVYTEMSSLVNLVEINFKNKKINYHTSENIIYIISVIKITERQLTKQKVGFMKAYSKEFYEAIEFFERCVTKSEYGNFRLDKPTQEERDKLPKGEWYNHGETNKAFRLFLSGIEYGRLLADN